MKTKQLEKHLPGCVVTKRGREVEVRGSGLSYRLASSRNGQVKREDADFLRSKIPTIALRGRIGPI